MSDNIAIAIIAVVGVTVPVLGTIATLFINRWFKKMDEKLDTYHSAVNGKMDKLLEVTGTSENAKGNLEGRAELKDEQQNFKT